MIQSLKRKFVLTAMLALCILLACIVTGMNIMSYNSVVKSSDAMLSLLSENRGIFPMPKGMMPRGMSPEAPYESRFFFVIMDGAGETVEVITERIAAVDDEMATDFAYEVMERGAERGFIKHYRYLVISEHGFKRITFLDCGRDLQSFYVFLRSSIAMSLLGLGLMFLIMMFSAQRIIRPVAEGYEKQKRFITDAGHEIKTPLTIISANADLLELDIGHNECISDIRQQTKRLTALTNDLVYLARMEEVDKLPELVELPISDIVQETAAGFKALAQAKGKDLVTDIEPMLSIKGEHKALEQLISILLENAIKYSPEGEQISLSFKNSGKALRLVVKNRSIVPLEPENIKHLFERFYRVDASRNSSYGGHGIGLSIASAITTAHGGKIQARSENGNELEIIVTLPL